MGSIQRSAVPLILAWLFGLTLYVLQRPLAQRRSPLDARTNGAAIASSKSTPTTKTNAPNALSTWRSRRRAVQRHGAPTTSPTRTTSKTTSATTLPKWLDPPFPHKSAPPAWCNALKKDPRERLRVPGMYGCGRGRYGAVCSDGKPRFFGQYNQDMYLYTEHFRHLKRRGTYLDIAANEPVRLSNTYFFDRCLHWRGICADANPVYHAPLRRHRTCALARICLSHRRSKETFILADGYSGLLSTNKNQHVSRRRNVTVHCERTAVALKALKVARIDLLSLDVEGHEAHVLRGVNFNSTKISVVVVENASAAVRKILLGHDFREHHVLGTRGSKAPPGQLFADTIFLHSSVRWGKPV